MNKKIIIATHEYSGIYKNIIDDLETSKYQVFPFIYGDYSKQKFRSIRDWLYYKYDKKIIKNKNAKKRILDRYQEEDLLDKICNFPNNYFDYSLFIRADFYSITLIKEIIRITKFNFSYHWDGMNRFSEIEERIELFDSFYVFEKDDYIQYSNKYSNIHLTTNFFFENTNKPDANFIYDIFYVGSYVNNRYFELIEIYDKLTSFEYNVNFMLYSPNIEITDKLPKSNINLFKTPINYQQIQNLSRSSKVVLDLVIKGHDSHKGLSLRFFEALQNNNKIITDNLEVLKYDFYHPNNIFIIGHDNWEDCPNFIKKEHFHVPSDIIKKYKFINWFEAKIS